MSVQNDSDYEKMVRRLVVMDEGQLLELFSDIVVYRGISDIERLADTAYQFIDTYEPTNYAERLKEFKDNENVKNDVLGIR